MDGANVEEEGGEGEGERGEEGVALFLSTLRAYSAEGRVYIKKDNPNSSRTTHATS